MTPQSQTGKKNPMAAPTVVPKNIFFGIILLKKFSEMNTWMTEDKMTPSNMKGKASSRILIKTVEKACTLLLIGSPHNKISSIILLN